MPTVQEHEMMFVLDGGSLLQRLPWPRDETFDAICKMYVDYVQRKYSKAIIVFDGYEAGPSTKDATHLRRSGGVRGAQVNFVGGMPLKSKKEHFLANSRNKQRFIFMLGAKLEETGSKTIYAADDADVLIAKTAVDSASRCATTVIGEDTDLLVLLCFHADPTAFPIVFRSEGKSFTKQPRIWNINWLQNNLGQNVCDMLPFVHAITGCDTTSRLFGIGKGVALKKLKEGGLFKDQAEVFSREATKEEISSAGEKAIACLYGGRPGEGLDALRYRRFREKVSASTSSVQVHTLPPTAAAASYHSARVHLQVREWLDKLDNMKAEEWGWDLHDNHYEPRATDLPPAPQALLQVIRCNCKADCDSKRCTCRKHGLDCSIACGACKGVSCANSVLITEDTDDPETLDEDG